MDTGGSRLQGIDGQAPWSLTRPHRQRLPPPPSLLHPQAIGTIHGDWVGDPAFTTKPDSPFTQSPSSGCKETHIRTLNTVWTGSQGTGTQRTQMAPEFRKAKEPMGTMDWSLPNVLDWASQNRVTLICEPIIQRRIRGLKASQ